jgi:hypothetical protein
MEERMLLPEMALEARMAKPRTTYKSLVTLGCEVRVLRTHHYNVGTKGDDSIADFARPVTTEQLECNVEERSEESDGDEEQEQSERELAQDGPDSTEDLVRVLWLR